VGKKIEARAQNLAVIMFFGGNNSGNGNGNGSNDI
jgi:hypothetical protein